MLTNHSPGRHRSPRSTRTLAARSAMSAGAAVAAVLLAGGPAAAATASAPAADPQCTGTALDAIVGPLTGADCNTNPEDNDPTNPGGPNTPDEGGTPATPTPGAPPISCTGTPLDAFTTCAGGGHGQSQGDRGDATGADTPSYGTGENDDGVRPPAG